MRSDCSSLSSAPRSSRAAASAAPSSSKRPSGADSLTSLPAQRISLEELDGLRARDHRVGVPLDVELGVEGDDRVEQRERALDGQRAGCSSALSAGRLVERITEEQQPVPIDIDHAAVGRVVSADVPHLDGGAAEVEVESVLEEGVRARDPDVPRRRHLLLDVRRVLRAPHTRFDPRVERLVAPVGRGERGQRDVRQLVRDHGRAHLDGAEDVIPVGVREHDRDRRRHTFGCERVEEQAGVCIRGAGVEHQRGMLADHSAQRRPVRLCRRQPVHVVAYSLQTAHRDTVVRVSHTSTVTIGPSVGGDLEQALEGVGVPSYVLDTTGIVRWVNPAAKRLLGDIRGRHFTSVVAPEDSRRARELFSRKVLGTSPATDATGVLVSTAGERVAVEISAVPLKSGDRVVGVFGLVEEQPDDRPTASLPHLTPRQLEVLRLLEQGRSTKQIAAELHLSTETVRNHIRRLFRALGVNSRLEAVAAARAASPQAFNITEPNRV